MFILIKLGFALLSQPREGEGGPSTLYYCPASLFLSIFLFPTIHLSKSCPELRNNTRMSKNYPSSDFADIGPWEDVVYTPRNYLLQENAHNLKPSSIVSPFRGADPSTHPDPKKLPTRHREDDPKTETNFKKHYTV